MLHNDYDANWKRYFYDIILELFVKEIYWLLDHQPISVSLVDSYLMSIFNLKSLAENLKKNKSSKRIIILCITKATRVSFYRRFACGMFIVHYWDLISKAALRWLQSLTRLLDYCCSCIAAVSPHDCPLIFSPGTANVCSCWWCCC